MAQDTLAGSSTLSRATRASGCGSSTNSRSRFLWLLAALFAAQAALGAESPIVKIEDCPADPVMTYEEYLEGEKRRDAQEVESARNEGHTYVANPAAYLTREQFTARAKEAARIQCQRLRYLSDGLQVVAFLWKPKAMTQAKLPLIIFNRGGNTEFGKVTPTHGFRRLALDGFVVLASQYRGNDGGEGKEEYGGADVRDIQNLLPVAEALGYVDTKNVFLLGWSRGGMMTALALKHGMKVNAAAVGGPLTDLLAERARRPQLGTRVWSKLMPGYAERADELLRERSPVFWADRIRTPMLILHGGADWRADPADTLAFAQALQKAGAKYQLIIYAGDDHGIRANREDSNRRIVEWFRAHMRPAPEVSLLSDDWQIVYRAKYELEASDAAALPKLIAILDRAEVVPLTNTADLIYPGAKEFHGHGWGIPYDLDRLDVRAGWALEELTFENFGFRVATTREARTAAIARAKAWYRSSGAGWSRYEGLKAALQSRDALRHLMALGWLRHGRTPCEGLTPETYRRDILPLVEHLSREGDQDVRQQASLLLGDEENFWWRYKSDPAMRRATFE